MAEMTLTEDLVADLRRILTYLADELALGTLGDDEDLLVAGAGAPDDEADPDDDAFDDLDEDDEADEVVDEDALAGSVERLMAALKTAVR